MSFRSYSRFITNNQALLIELFLWLITTKPFAQENKLLKARFVAEIMSPFQLKEQDKLTDFAAELMQNLINWAEVNGKIEVYLWARVYNIALSKPNVFML